MASINDIVSYSPKQPAGSQAATGTSSADLTQNFLKLLTAQLRNQDPMSPIDNANMTSQLAALNQVDGINRLNDSVKSLVDQMSAASFVNLSNSIGKVALSKSPDVYFSGQPQSFAVGVNEPVTDAAVTVKDDSGSIIRTLSLGDMPSGINDFVWLGDRDDGSKAESGKTYHLEVSAKGLSGGAVTSDLYTGAAVVAIGNEAGSTIATLADGRRVEMGKIVKWLAI